MKTITLEQLAQAIEDNGAPQYFDWYTNGSEENPAYCAIGMAAHNLSVDPGSLDTNLSTAFGGLPSPADHYEDTWGLGAQIVYLNDHIRMTFKQIADWIREEYAGRLDETVRV